MIKIQEGAVPTPIVKKVRDYILSLPANELEYPAHRYDLKIMELLAYIRPVYGELCEPQIVRQEKCVGERGTVEYHVDEEPPWAKDRKYTQIVGVALTYQEDFNGIVEFERNKLNPLFMMPGDVLYFTGDEPHATGWNSDDRPRVMVYFRFLGFTSEDERFLLD